MRVGLTLSGDNLSESGARFAAQLGVTDVVIHLNDYAAGPDAGAYLRGDAVGPVLKDGRDVAPWDFETMSGITAMLARHGLAVAALENFAPAFWSDILLDGPRRAAQMDGLKQLVRDAGRAGIPVIGYNFSIAGVWGWRRRPVARGRRDDRRHGSHRRGARHADPGRHGLEHALSATATRPPLPSRSERRSCGSVSPGFSRARAGGRGGRRAPRGASRRSAARDAARHGAAREPAREIRPPARARAEPRQRAGILHRLAPGNAGLRHLRRDAALRAPRTRWPMSTSATCAAECRITSRPSSTTATST